jgi:hypothetical protein
MTQNKTDLNKLGLLCVVLLSLGGLFYLSLIDTEYRPMFADLAKMGVGAYIGWMLK